MSSYRQDAPPIEVPLSEVFMTEDYEYLRHGKPFTGLAYRDYQGRRLTETTFEDGMKSGCARTWYPESEQLYSELFYATNSLHGVCRYWYENGQLKSELEVDHGITLRETTWDQHGDLVKVYELSPDDPDHPQARQRRPQG